MALDAQKLVKLLMLTTSSFDGEALAAIRKANQMLCDAKTSWQQYFQQLSKPPEPAYRRPNTPPNYEYDRDKIDRAFDILDREINAENPTKFEEFLQSLHDQWVRRGSLSAKQKAALYRAANI